MHMRQFGHAHRTCAVPGRRWYFATICRTRPRCQCVKSAFLLPHYLVRANHAIYARITRSKLKKNVRLRKFLLAVSVGVAAGSATALSLGNPQGVVVLGRPLDLTFEVRTDGAEPGDACIHADVVAGDSAVPRSQVGVTPVGPRAGRSATVRVQTTQPITEPILSVQLSAGCSGKVVRTYALLAYPAEALTAQQRAAVAATAAFARPSEQAAARAVPQGSADTAARQPASATAKPPTATQRPKRPASVSRPVPPKAVPKPAREAGRPRLVMEPLSDWLQAPSMLRASPELASLSPATPEQRADAAARWRLLNMQPQEMLDEAARMVAQESELAAQRAQAERDRAAALEVQRELQQRIAERYSAIVVYSLLALLVLLAAALLWLWSRQRRIEAGKPRVWTEAVFVPDAADAPDASASEQVQAPAACAEHSLRGRPTEPELLPSGMMPLEFGSAADATSHVRTNSQPNTAVASTSAPAPVAVTAVVNPEDLFDLQQQAEFFVSVGEHDQAIDVMKQHIEANRSSSPFAYLELLRLYRSLSRIEQFNALRAQFHQYFNAQVPEFAAFSRQGKTLFSYPDVLARIEALWCDPSVVLVLQELLFRGVGDEYQRFDLPAYDDLLLLHSVARTTPAAARGVTAPRTRTTPLEPEEWEAPHAELPVATSAPVSNLMEFEPDWDFEAPKYASAEPAPSSGAPALDLDLSDLTHLDALSERPDGSAPLPLLSQDEQPPVPATAPPAPHQPVGFGSNSDRFEARIDPDERKPN